MFLVSVFSDMSAITTNNSTIDLKISALRYGTLAILAAQKGIDISTLIIREGAARQARAAHPGPVLLPAPPPGRIAGAEGVLAPVVVTGAEPDLNLR